MILLLQSRTTYGNDQATLQLSNAYLVPDSKANLSNLGQANTEEINGTLTLINSNTSKLVSKTPKSKNKLFTFTVRANSQSCHLSICEKRHRQRVKERKFPRKTLIRVIFGLQLGGQQ